MMRVRSAFALVSSCLLAAIAVPAATWNCELLPAEHIEEIDPGSGAKVVFVTTDPASDTNLYFHKRCIVGDNRLLLFYSERFGRNEVMGYLLETGQLARLNPADAPAAGAVVASVRGDRLFVFKENSIWEWLVEFAGTAVTSVQITERKVVDMPEGAQQRSFHTENSDGSLLAFTYLLDDAYYIGFCDSATGELLPAAKLNFKPDHLQFHWNRPDLLAFNCIYESDVAPIDPDEPPHARIWFMNVHTRIPIPAFYQVPGEIVTHECWWVNDQITFIGGHHHEGDREEGNVKVLDLKTGEIRIVGAGAWIEKVPGSELSQVNWWHSSGSPDGKWVVADNWHGIVALFNGKTTEKKVLTSGHRTYGGGHHLHVGWDARGDFVEFTSNRRGNTDVCIAVIPEDWKTQ